MTIAMTISTLAAINTFVNAADVTTPDNDLLMLLNNLANGAQSVEVMRFDQIATPSNPAASKNKLYFKSSDHLYMLNSSGVETQVDGLTINRLADGRLSLQTGSPAADGVTAATSVYYTPYTGFNISLYSNSAWVTRQFTEKSLSLSGFAASTLFDIFGYDSSNTLALEALAWTNSTTRATALAYQNGVLVKSGDPTRRYLGTIQTTGVIGQCEDSQSKRFCWNYYNRIPRYLSVVETTDSWTYGTATWHQWNASNTNRVSFVIGVAESVVDLTFIAGMTNSSSTGLVAIGLDSTSVPSGIYGRNNISTPSTCIASIRVLPTEGSHFLQLLEYASAASTTFFGDNTAGVAQQSGANGSLAA